VPIVLVGEDVRESDGGVVTQALRELPVSCLPTAIPERIEVDISGLVIGDTITVGQISLPEGVHTSHDGEDTVVSILAPAAAPAQDAEAEGDEGGDEEAQSEEGGGEEE